MSLTAFRIKIGFSTTQFQGNDCKWHLDFFMKECRWPSGYLTGTTQNSASVQSKWLSKLNYSRNDLNSTLKLKIKENQRTLVISAYNIVPAGAFIQDHKDCLSIDWSVQRVEVTNSC